MYQLRQGERKGDSLQRTEHCVEEEEMDTGLKLIFREIGLGGEDRDLNHYWQSLGQIGTKYLFVFSDKEGP